LVVDLMCHSISGTPSERATSAASTDLPVPGSPLMSSGRCSVMAALTATFKSSVATYVFVPSKRIGKFLVSCRANCGARLFRSSDRKFEAGDQQGGAWPRLTVCRLGHQKKRRPGA